MQMSALAWGIWIALCCLSIFGIWGCFKLYHISVNEQKRIIKSIAYSFLISIGIVLVPIILEMIFPLPQNCSAQQKSWSVDCAGTHINWHYIQTMVLFCYFVIVFCIWSIWDVLYGKLYKISVRFERVIRCALILLGFLMMLPLAWLRNFLLGIF